jgi:hypothetical protein
MLYGTDHKRNAQVRVDRLKKKVMAHEGGRKKKWYNKQYYDLKEALDVAEKELARLSAPPRKTTTRSYTRKA